MWGSNGEAWKREHPRARPVRLLFQDERATPAVLTFLMETKVGKVVNLASLWERDGGGDRPVGEGWRGEWGDRAIPHEREGGCEGVENEEGGPGSP